MTLPNRVKGNTVTKKTIVSQKKVAIDNNRTELTEVQKNKILQALLKSEIETDATNRIIRSVETHKIANRFKVGPMQIAGVRANMNRGAYGNKKTLLANYRKANSTAS